MSTKNRQIPKTSYTKQKNLRIGLRIDAITKKNMISSAKKNSLPLSKYLTHAHLYILNNNIPL